MKPEEFSGPAPTTAAEPSVASEPPEVEALLRHYRARARARRQRRRHMLIATLLGGGVLVIAVLSVLPRVRNGRVVMPLPAPATSVGPPSRAAPEPSPQFADPLAPEPKTLAVAKVIAAPRPPATSAEVSTPLTVIVRPQPSERLTVVRTGDAKERVFELFASTVQRQKDTLVRIDGIRLRARGQSPDHPKLEVADVEVAENGRAQKYWFLFGEGSLLAWGRPTEWPVTAARFKLEIEYR
jgi:hypothetical protein